MKPIYRNGLRAAGLLAGAAVLGAGAFVFTQTSRFDASIDKVYDVPPMAEVVHSDDPAVIARGKHLASSVAGCTVATCHGPDLGGGQPMEMGPVMTAAAPNITPSGLGAGYSDGELGRLLRHGIKKDGRSIRFMTVQDFNWLSDSDLSAIVSFLRVAPPVERENHPTVIKTLGKVLDRQDKLVIDVARHIDRAAIAMAPAPARTEAYGAFVSRACTGCHGDHLSGGRIPGAPGNLPIPLNLTPDASGLEDWTFEDFERALRQAVRKNGKALDPFMPVEAWRNLDDVEMHALWAYLRSIPPLPLGGR